MAKSAHLMRPHNAFCRCIAISAAVATVVVLVVVVGVVVAFDVVFDDVVEIGFDDDGGGGARIDESIAAIADM